MADMEFSYRNFLHLFTNHTTDHDESSTDKEGMRIDSNFWTGLDLENAKFEDGNLLGKQKAMTSVFNWSTIDIQSFINRTLQPRPWDQAYELWLVKQLRLYYIPTVIMIGILSQLLTGLVYLKACRSGNRKGASYMHYILGLCVTGILHLITLLIVWLEEVGIDIYQYSGLCHHIAFVMKASRFLYTWYMVALCVDRYLSVSWTTLAEKMATRCRARCICLAFATLAVIVFLNTALMEGVSVVQYGHAKLKVCSFLPYFMDVTVVLNKLDLVINCFIPCIFILILSSLILMAVLQCKIQPECTTLCQHCLAGQSTHSATHSHISIQLSRESQESRLPCRTKHSAIATLVVAQVFLVLVLPDIVLRGIQAFGEPMIKMSPAHFICQSIFQNLSRSSQAFNWSIFLSIDKDFRKSLFKILRCILELAQKLVCVNNNNNDKDNVMEISTQSLNVVQADYV